jgi:hypothetical protein
MHTYKASSQAEICTAVAEHRVLTWFYVQRETLSQSWLEPATGRKSAEAMCVLASSMQPRSGGTSAGTKDRRVLDRAATYLYLPEQITEEWACS